MLTYVIGGSFFFFYKATFDRECKLCLHGFLNLLPLSPLPQLVIRVHMSDESSKTMMVDERQTVRQVLDSLLDKSHCGYSPDWSLVETINELQMGKGAAADRFHHTFVK